MTLTVPVDMATRHTAKRFTNGGYGTGVKPCHFRVEGGVALT